MKTILRFFFLLFVLANCMGLTAQEDSPKRVSFQPRVGMNISNVTATHDNITIEGDEKVGFNIGALADIYLGKSFYLQPGLVFTTKGTKVDDIYIDGNTFEAKMNAMYLQIPLYASYKLQLNKWDNRLGFSLGPYFAYGVGGKTDYSLAGNKTSISIDTFDSDGMWNKFDVGLGLEIYFELKRIVFTMGGEVSFTRAWKKEFIADGITPRNNNLYYCVGYKF